MEDATVVVMAGYMRARRLGEVDDDDEEEEKGQRTKVKGQKVKQGRRVGETMGGCAVSSTVFGQERHVSTWLLAHVVLYILYSTVPAEVAAPSGAGMVRWWAWDGEAQVQVAGSKQVAG
ncbi:hypothetical protein V493_07035 [Pseudogymnoascus sp. VKM F-4281 (FW-2241)]|nr:hypothetical protein V493_07035 [Pseudogymnoascus sp. VKM F-4281 (FW-2241)]